MPPIYTDILGASVNRNTPAGNPWFAPNGPYPFTLVGTFPPGLQIVFSRLSDITVNYQILGVPDTLGSFDYEIHVINGFQHNDQVFEAGAYLITSQPGCGILVPTPTPLPAATQGVWYSQQLSTSGGTPPYTYAVYAGVLPLGLTLSPSGLLSGVPLVHGLSTLGIRIVDSLGCLGFIPAALAELSILPGALMERFHAFSRLNGSGDPSAYATITVYLTGTATLANLYASNNLADPLSNPFTAGADGLVEFYAVNGHYDIQFSGGQVPEQIATPWALGDVLLDDSADIPPPAPLMLGYYNAKTDFGAVADDVTDDTAAIQAGFNSIPSGSEVYFPAGTYHLTAALTITAKGLWLRGAGTGHTLLSWSAGTGGIAFNQSAVYDQQVQVSDLSLQTSQASGGTALSITYPSAASVNEITARITRVQVLPTDHTTAGRYWTIGLLLDGAWNSIVTDFDCHFDNTGPAVSGTIGIHITGAATAVTVRGAFIYNANTGVLVEGQVEGPLLSAVVVLGGVYGIVVNTDFGRPGTLVEACHTYTDTVGIWLRNHPQSTIVNCLFYKSVNSSQNYIGILLGLESDFCRLSGNQVIILAPSTGSDNGIVIQAGFGGVAMGNSAAFLTGLGVTVGLEAPTGGWAVVGNTRFQGSATVHDIGSGNTLAGNAP